MVDKSDPAHPTVVGEFKTAYNTDAYCQSPAGQDPNNTTYTSYSSHNLTVLPDRGFVDWHSAGLQAIDISDPTHPTSAGQFSPGPLASVATEDPALSRGMNKVVLWSYPIIYKGLIYVIDIRSGLYILRYTGPNASEVSHVRFLEGKSNLGDTLRLEGASAGSGKARTRGGRVPPWRKTTRKPHRDIERPGAARYRAMRRRPPQAWSAE